MKQFSCKIVLLLIACLAVSLAAGAAEQHPPLAGQVPTEKLKPGFSNMILVPLATDSVTEELQKIVVLCATATPEAASRISPSGKNMLVSVIQLLREGKTAKALQEWRELVLNLKNSKSPTSINELIYWIGRQAYLKTEKDLTVHSFRIKTYTAQQNTTQQELQQNRFRLNNCMQTKGCIPGRVRELQKEIKNLEDTLQTVQTKKHQSLALLVQELQKSSAVAESLSSTVLKMHDSARAIVSYL